MKITLFTFCDGAYNYNGKLTIVGAKDGFHVRSLPEKVSFNIALKFVVLPHEILKGKLYIQFVDPESKFLPAKIECEIDVSSQDENNYISLAASMSGVPLEKEGLYKAIVSMETKACGEYDFFVKKDKS